MLGDVATPFVDNERLYWIKALERIVVPVLENGARRSLKSTMPIEAKEGSTERNLYSHLEAVGRSLAGIAPWLECNHLTGEEETLRYRYADLAKKTIASIVDPASPDFLNFSAGNQPLVDAAFLAQGILRAPTVLLDSFDPASKRHLRDCMLSIRHNCRAHFSNWLLFAAMVEVLLYRMGEDWDFLRIDYALREHEEWYMGDGAYGDGPKFRFDYYNSFVIQPMIVDVLIHVGNQHRDWQRMMPAALNRIRRYAVVLERLIGPDGSYPPVGRSITYRFGAFHALADVALMRELPESLAPNQVRSAMTAVLQKYFAYPDMFTEDGWLQIGLYGHQPMLAEPYISTGSLYLFAVGFLPLGLPPDDVFWSAPKKDWTQRLLQSGQDLMPDHAWD